MSESAEPARLVWSIISTLGDNDRAFATNLAAPEWHGFNLSAQPAEILPGLQDRQNDRAA